MARKLVRDRIPEIIRKKGEKADIVVATLEEFNKYLGSKILEEVGELLANPSIEEVADILEVIEAYCEHHRFDKIHLRQVKDKKLRERGGFNKRLILSVPDSE